MADAEYVAAVLADSPRVFWKLQEASGNPQDSSGNGLHITTVDATPGYHAVGPMVTDYAMSCDGSGDVMHRAAIAFATDNITTEFWIRVTTGGGWVFAANNAMSNGWYVAVTGALKFQAVVNGVTQALSALALTADLYYYIAVVRRATVWEYWVNGNSDTANAGTTTPGTPTGTLDIFDTGGFNARVAYLAIYETALSGATIAAHYAAATASGQILLPDADLAAGGWTTSPLFSKVNDSSDATVITATAS